MARRNLVYQLKALRKFLFGIGILALLQKLSGGSSAILYPLLAFFYVSRHQTIHSFFIVLMMIAATVGNNYFFPKNFVFGIAVRLSLIVIAFLMTIRISGRRQSPLLKPLMGIVPYLLWECISSAQGYAPIVSYLKLTLFTFIYFAFYSVANSVVLDIRADARQLRTVALAFAILFLLGSIALIPFPGIGLMKQMSWGGERRLVLLESLFQGMTNHSQSLGPIVAAFALLVMGDMLFSVKRLDKLYMALILSAPILVYKTSSRTAMGTLLGGMFVLAWLFLRARGVGGKWRQRIMNFAFGFGLLATCLIVLTPSTRDAIGRFALKGKAGDTVQKGDLSFEAVTSSRAGLMNGALANFRQKPLIGNGFQVEEAMVHEKRVGFLSYLSAPIEKGVWVSAVLEEGGIVGFVLFAGFLLCTFFTFIKRHAYIAASVLFAMTLSNMGEFTFFSMSYTGGLCWALVFTAAVMDAQRLKEQRLGMMW